MRRRPPHRRGPDPRLVAPASHQAVVLSVADFGKPPQPALGATDRKSGSHLTGYSPEAFARRLADPQTTFLVAERFVRDEPHLVAFAEITVGRPSPVGAVSSGGADAELVRLYLQRRFQGKGLGADLLHRAERTASEQGAGALWLSAWSGNRAALAFYRAHGYRTAGTSEYVFENRTYETKILVKALVDAE